MVQARKKATSEAQIDENLRRIFEEDCAGELPAHLQSLLDKLDSIEIPAALTGPSDQHKG